MTGLPNCPQDYNCTFTRISPRVIEHHIGPWWHGGGGIAVAIVAVIAICVVLCTAVYYTHQLIKDKRERHDYELSMKTKIAVEEQKTFQAEQAKGNPEMLKLIREDR